MFTSRTSVGVQERSASSSTVFVSEDKLCCCAWRRLDSRRDSICSWQARKQSCRKVQWKGREWERPKIPSERSQAKIPVSWQSKRNVTGLSGRAAGWKGGWEEQKHPTVKGLAEQACFFADSTWHCCFSACAVYSSLQAHCSQLCIFTPGTL